MARAAPPGTLELLLHKATDPSNSEENWECIQRFSDQVNADADSIAAALKLLEHKIQSPQEAEALHALTVLEMCVNNCGENFHHEMGKFRFLNGLIKVLSPKEQEKSAKVSRRLNALKEARSSAEALEEMLRSWRESKGVGTTPSTLELLQATFAKCERLKPLLFRVASETVEDEEALGEVLQASDRLTRALCFYKDVVGTAGDSGTSSGGAAAGPQPLPDAASSLTLIDLSELGAGCQAPLQENAKTEPFLERLLSSSSTHSLDEELMLGLPISPTAAAPPVSSQIPEMAPALLPPCPASSSSSLAKLSIPLSSITLSTIPPVTVYEEKGLKAMLHFSRDPVPGQPATRVLVLSLLSTAPHPVQDIVFQAAVPKSMAIKLQPATGSELPAFNPLLPPTVISQVLLLANPHQAPLRLRYRLSFVQNGTPCIETGEVSDFPHAELWGGI
ncbi:ADP-ribosylation factor-binding protein GGA2 isoform X3 [Podarcis muralis]